MVLQSEIGTLEIISKGDNLELHFDDWKTISFFLKAGNHQISDFKSLLKLTGNLAQQIIVYSGDSILLAVKDGKIKKWSFSSVIRYLRFRLFS
jgi:hypothetical protein